MPCVIAERLFTLTDSDSDGNLSQSEFISIVLKINSSDMSIKLKLVFDLYDFDSNGLISAQDVRTLLLHTINIPLSSPMIHSNVPLLDTHKAKEYVNK